MGWYEWHVGYWLVPSYGMIRANLPRRGRRDWHDGLFALSISRIAGKNSQGKP